MALTSHVVLVLERSCYGWGHIMSLSDNIFVNKRRYGVVNVQSVSCSDWKLACLTVWLNQSLLEMKSTKVDWNGSARACIGQSQNI